MDRVAQRCRGTCGSTPRDRRDRLLKLGGPPRLGRAACPAVTRSPCATSKRVARTFASRPDRHKKRARVPPTARSDRTVGGCRPGQRRSPSVSGERNRTPRIIRARAVTSRHSRAAATPTDRTPQKIGASGAQLGAELRPQANFRCRPETQPGDIVRAVSRVAHTVALGAGRGATLGRSINPIGFGRSSTCCEHRSSPPRCRSEPLA